MSHYEEMDYQLTGSEPENTEMCMDSAVEPIDMTVPEDTEMRMVAAELAPTDAEMRQARRYREAAEDPHEDEDEIPPPPPLVRQNAVYGPRVSVREQEIQYIEENGLVAFCRDAIVTAILQDADYLRAQLTYLRR